MGTKITEDVFGLSICRAAKVTVYCTFRTEFWLIYDFDPIYVFCNVARKVQAIRVWLQKETIDVNIVIRSNFNVNKYFNAITSWLHWDGI